jgi:hypothetical protein
MPTIISDEDYLVLKQTVTENVKRKISIGKNDFESTLLCFYNESKGVTSPSRLESKELLEDVRKALSEETFSVAFDIQDIIVYIVEKEIMEEAVSIFRNERWRESL